MKKVINKKVNKLVKGQTSPQPSPNSLGEGAVLHEFMSGRNAGEVNFNVMNLLPYRLNALLPSRKVAFTLAEVLITLGIIGVVAAITLPTLIAKIQDRVNIVRWKKSYSIISQAAERVKNRNINNFCNTPYKTAYGMKCLSSGGENITGYKNISFSNEFLVAFIEELNPVDICFTNAEPKCTKQSWNMKDEYSLLNKPDSHINTYNFSGAHLLLKDGSVVYIGGSHGEPWISVDVNGAINKPNQLGRDLFVMKGFNSKILPLGANGTFNTTVNGEQCLCGEQYGQQTNATYFAGSGGEQRVASGGCCSAYYLLK